MRLDKFYMVKNQQCVLKNFMYLSNFKEIMIKLNLYNVETNIIRKDLLKIFNQSKMLEIDEVYY